jgi:putative oxygen-independent coproporphyrinogen III oxidase
MLASSARAAAASAAYVHMPFCRRRCFYCDFPIQVVGAKQGAADVAAERYCGLLHREMEATFSALATEQQQPLLPLRSLYFGGGTPSLTPPPLLADTITLLRERCGLESSCEITLEMDPGTFDEARLEAFVDAGVTRVSLGVQSFDEELLKGAGRSHGVAEAQNALRLLLDACDSPSNGLRSVSLDLIGGLPGQSRDSWQRSLDAAAASGVHHVSVYDLQVEPRTAFGRWFESGKLTSLPSEEDAAQFFRDASTKLGSGGFERYEVSSFARPGHRSQHNAAYWRNEPFYGFGLGATSHMRYRRLARPRSMQGYESFVSDLESSGLDAVHQQHEAVHEEGKEAMTTRLMLALRTREGIELAELRDNYGEALGEAAAMACHDAASELPSEWLSTKCNAVDSNSTDGAPVAFALSDPEGLLFSNDAIATVFARLDERLEESGVSDESP